MTSPPDTGSPDTLSRKHSIRIAGHPTSVSLEPIFRHALESIARARAQSLGALVTEIDKTRGMASLSSALRVYALEWYMDRPENKKES